MKGIILEKNYSFKAYPNNCSNIVSKNRLSNLQVGLNSSTEFAKEKFYNRIVNKLSGTQKNA